MSDQQSNKKMKSDEKSPQKSDNEPVQQSNTENSQQSNESVQQSNESVQQSISNPENPPNPESEQSENIQSETDKFLESLSGCTSLLEEDDTDQIWKIRRPIDDLEIHRWGGYKLVVYAEMDCHCTLKKQPEIGDSPNATRTVSKRIKKGLNVMCLCTSLIPRRHTYELRFPDHFWNFSFKGHPGVICITVHQNEFPTLETRASRKFHKLFIGPDQIKDHRCWSQIPKKFIEENISFTYRQKRILSFNRRGQNNDSCRLAFLLMKGHSEFLSREDEPVNFERDWHEVCTRINSSQSTDWTMEYNDLDHKLFCKIRGTADGTKYYCKKCQIFCNYPPTAPGRPVYRPLRRRTTDN